MYVYISLMALQIKIQRKVTTTITTTTNYAFPRRLFVVRVLAAVVSLLWSYSPPLLLLLHIYFAVVQCCTDLCWRLKQLLMHFVATLLLRCSLVCHKRTLALRRFPWCSAAFAVRLLNLRLLLLLSFVPGGPAAVSR